MKLKINVSIAGQLNENDHYSYRPGDVVTVADIAEAKRFIDAGFAIPVVEAPEISEAPVTEKRGKSK